VSPRCCRLARISVSEGTWPRAHRLTATIRLWVIRWGQMAQRDPMTIGAWRRFLRSIKCSLSSAARGRVEHEQSNIAANRCRPYLQRRLAAAPVVPCISFDGTTPLTRNRPAAPESWRESENHRRAHRAKHRHFPVAHLANTAAEQPEIPQPRHGGPITGKAASRVVPSVPTDGLNRPGFDAHPRSPEHLRRGINPSFIHR
jgi:hypothetical protein